MSVPRIILASSSPRRLDLLRELGLDFEAIVGKAEEIQPEHLTPREICQINAYRKARAVAKQHPDALVLGADTVVCLGAQVFGKPADRVEASRMLGTLQGQTHEVLTGVCLILLRRHRQRLFAVSTSVKFRPLSNPDIQKYLARINPLDKAGAYAIQEHGEMVVETIEGSFSNVVGLPLERLRAELDAWNLSDQASELER